MGFFVHFPNCLGLDERRHDDVVKYLEINIIIILREVK